MRLERSLPPNYEEICKTLSPGETTVFTYGNILFVPENIDISQIEDHLLVHEEVHMKQQEKPDEWWNTYLADQHFRLEQELEAYGVQYAFVMKKTHISAKQRKNFLERIASDLASPLYGNLISQTEAESMIRNKAKSINLEDYQAKAV